MSWEIRRRNRAKQDLIDTYRFYAREAGIAVADRFLSKAESSFLRLADMPRLGARFEQVDPIFGELRYLTLPAPFKSYVIFYRDSAGGIEIARVLHAARDIAAILADEFHPPDGGTPPAGALD